MAQRSRWQSTIRWTLPAALLGIVVLAAAVTWYVTVPASRVSNVIPDGIPAHAAPRLTVSEIRDLPMQCTMVAEGGAPNERGRPPHRNHLYLAKHDGLYFAMFSYWYGAEGQVGQAVRSATSRDGRVRSEPRALADPAVAHGIIARGFVERDGRLFARHATHTGDTFFRNGKEFADPAQYEAERSIAILESEGLGEAEGWRFNRVVLEGYASNYAPRAVGGELVMALREQDRDFYLATSADNGMTWDVGPAMPAPPVPVQGDPGLYLPDEPVVTSRDEGATRVLLRNNNTEDGRLCATAIVDGERQQPYPLHFPSEASKFVPLELGDGTAALLGNFEPEVHRALLHLALAAISACDRGRRRTVVGLYLRQA